MKELIEYMDSKYTIVTPVRETGQNINSYRIYVRHDAKNWELYYFLL